MKFLARLSLFFSVATKNQLFDCHYETFAIYTTPNQAVMPGFTYRTRHFVDWMFYNKTCFASTLDLGVNLIGLIELFEFQIHQ